MKYYFKFLIPFTFRPGCEESNFLSVRDRGVYPTPIVTTLNAKIFKIWIDENNHNSIIHEESPANSKEYGIYKSINLSVELDAEENFYENESHPVLNEIAEDSSLIFDKFIKYIKIRKNQYWLDYNNRNNNDFFNLWECKISTDGENWNEFRISTSIALSLKMVGFESYFDNSDITAIQQFIEGSGKVPFEEEVISNVRYLMDIKQNKAATVELYIYLEAFVHRFVKNIDIEKRSHIESVNIEELPKYLKRIGVSAFVCYILPLFIPEITKEKYEKIHNFITLRQNIIHNQQGDVSDKNLRAYFLATTELTKKMREYIK